MKRAIVSIMAVAATLWATTSPALAAPPVITHHLVADASGYWATCPQGFDVMFTAHVDATYWDFYDTSGDVVRTMLHYSFTGTLFNGRDPSVTVPYSGTNTIMDIGDQETWSGVPNVAWIDGVPLHLETGHATNDASRGIWQETAVCPYLVP